MLKDKLLNIYFEEESFAVRDERARKNEVVLQKIIDKCISFINTKYLNKRIHITNKFPLKLNKGIIKQEYSQKPDGFWYGIGSSWLSLLKEYPEWMGRYCYVIEVSNVIDLSTKVDEIDLYKVTNDVYAWQEILKDFQCDAIEVSKLDIIKQKFPAWEVPSGCIWKNDGNIKLSQINLPLTTEDIKVIETSASQRG